MSKWQEQKSEINRGALARLTGRCRTFPTRRAPPRPRPAVHSADAASCDRFLWRAHPLRADRLARALAARSGQPDGWTWQLGKARARPAGDLPYAARALSRSASRAGRRLLLRVRTGVYQFGWHVDLWGNGPNKRAPGTAPASSPGNSGMRREQAPLLRRLQARRCGQTGGRLEERGGGPSRAALSRLERISGYAMAGLLDYWGMPNLQVINRDAHVLNVPTRRAIEARGACRRPGTSPRTRHKSLIVCGNWLRGLALATTIDCRPWW